MRSRTVSSWMTTNSRAALLTRMSAMAGLDNSRSAILAAIGRAENRTCTTTSARITGRFCNSAALPPNHQLQTRPRLVHCANLYINQSERQRYGPDDILRDVRFHTRRFLGPRNPDRAVGRDRLHQKGQLLCERCMTRLENMCHVRLLTAVAADGQTRHLAFNNRFIIIRRADHANVLARLDAKLLIQWFA